MKKLLIIFMLLLIASPAFSLYPIYGVHRGEITTDFMVTPDDFKRYLDWCDEVVTYSYHVWWDDNNIQTGTRNREYTPDLRGFYNWIKEQGK
jgi:hypothetical protein